MERAGFQPAVSDAVRGDSMVERSQAIKTSKQSCFIYRF